MRLEAAGAESLWDELLPEEVKLLPDDLAALDELLCDRALLAPIVARWEVEAREMARSSVNHGRPTIAMDTFVRLMVLKHRHGWGYRTLRRRSRTRFICVDSLGSVSRSGWRTSRRSGR